MDTKEVAEHLGTTPRVLRQFLRSHHSSFVPVGSGARYEFTDREMPTIQKRFAEWHQQGKPRPESATKPSTPRPAARDVQLEQDRKIWAEEGPIDIPDIRDPQVRAQVQAVARAAEERLMLRLLAVGQHITQLGDRASA